MIDDRQQHSYDLYVHLRVITRPREAHNVRDTIKHCKFTNGLYSCRHVIPEPKVQSTTFNLQVLLVRQCCER